MSASPPTISVEQAYSRALEHHQAGRLREAEAIYRQILSRQPDHADTLHHLGVLAQQTGRSAEAVEFISGAVVLKPNVESFHLNHGVALASVNRLDDAMSAFNRALSLRPNSAEAYRNLSDVLNKKGMHEQAAAAARQALNLRPDFVEAFNNLGSALQSLGQWDESIAAFTKAIELRPNSFAGYYNLGNAAMGAGQLQRAMEAYQKALALQPDSIEVRNNLGRALIEAGRPAESLEHFNRALAFRPEFVEARHNRGDALMKLARFDLAVEEYRAVLRVRPHFFLTHYQLGDALAALKRHDEAIEEYRQAIAIMPTGSAAYNNLGHCLAAIGKLDEAVVAYRQSIAADENNYLALNNLGNAFFYQGKMNEAVFSFERCIAVKPDYPQVYSNLGNALWAMGKMDESIAAYRKALAIKPDYVNAISNLAGDLKDTGRLDEAMELYLKIQQLDPGNARLQSNYIYVLNMHSDSTPGKILREQKRWDRQHGQPLASQIRSHQNDRDPDRRLRIGYVSADFHKHVVTWNLIPILEQHDHSGFEVFCYSNAIRSDELTKKVKSLSDRWRPITGVEDDRVVETIRKDQIDILIDLSMHSAGNRLQVFARKPAPLQMTYLGYCGSAGVAAIDYRFSDPYLDNPQTEPNYTEKTLYLPNCYWCFRPGGESPDVVPPPMQERGFITFGCLNNFAKMSQPAQKLWAGILNAVKDSRLLLHAQPGSHVNEVIQRFADWGITADRLEFAPKQSWEIYIQGYQRIDIALDPFPFNGGITTCDALWMGVPVVTLAGENSIGRAGKSVLSNIGLPELVAETPEKYFAIATELAGDPNRLAELRAGIRQKLSNSPLMNAPQFTADFERALRGAWRNWCSGA